MSAAEMRRARGFTLLEVLVALVILALSAATVLRQTQLSIKQQYELELKSSALWIADGVMAELLVQSQWPPLGRAEQKQNYHDRDWVVTTDVQTTPDPMLRKIDISIGVEAGSGSVTLLSMTAYRGQY